MPTRQERDAYMCAGRERALTLRNRGPIRFQSDGSLHPDVLDAYSRYGFYVFEGVLGEAELADLAADLADLRERLPVSNGAPVDARGRPALGARNQGLTVLWSKPLGDPLGGTAVGGGRHQVEMYEPEPREGAPDEAVFLVVGSLQYSDAHLRLYAHPELLRVAAAINGPDFAPFNEGIFIKDPGLGASVSWHQDGATWWDHPSFDEDCHGFNFMAQLHGSTPENGVWVLPGSHRSKVDIIALARQAGSDLLEGAVPLVCGPGDVVINNRQVVHGSFPNESDEPRVSFNFGFHRRRSVLDVMGAGIHTKAEVYDADRIRERTRVLGYAIEARKQRFPDEAPFVYEPFATWGDEFVWNDQARASLRDYNLLDLSI